MWIDDLARCAVEALGNDKARNETYPMGGPDQFTWPQFYSVCRGYWPQAINKPILAVPVRLAKFAADKPGVPFGYDQVVMSQEDSICDQHKLEADFAISLSPFEQTFAQYADQV